MSSAASSMARVVRTDSPCEDASGTAIRRCTTPASSPPDFAELLLGLARELRVRAHAVEDEDAADRLAAKLLAEAVGGIQRVERLGNRQHSPGRSP